MAETDCRNLFWYSPPWVRYSLDFDPKIRSGQVWFCMVSYAICFIGNLNIISLQKLSIYTLQVLCSSNMGFVFMTYYQKSQMSQQKVFSFWFRQYSTQSENSGATMVVPVAPVDTSPSFSISYNPNSKRYLKVWALAASSSRWIWQNRTVQFVILLCKAPFRIFFRLLRSAFEKNCHI